MAHSYFAPVSVRLPCRWYVLVALRDAARMPAAVWRPPNIKQTDSAQNRRGIA